MDKKHSVLLCSVLLVFALCTACATHCGTCAAGHRAGKIKGPQPEKFPPPQKCANCHNVLQVYEELSAGPHKELKCLDCHIPGKVQRAKYESKDCGFARLGYYEQAGNWIECADGNLVCLRCHEGISNSGEQCWSCHMGENGMDEIVILKNKEAPRTPENIRETERVIHRNHTLKHHSN